MSEITIREALSWAQKKIDPLDAQIIMAQILHQTKAYLLTYPEKEISETEYALFVDWVNQRAQAYPLAYLTGVKSFWDMDLKVTPEVLIPRPETELLVETALSLLPPAAKVLELATGSGAVACALYRARPDLKITASDISPKALEIAQENARTYECQVDFILSDWFVNIPQETFDLILANPPYLSETDPYLETGLRFEPRQALVSGSQGDECYQRIIAQANVYLKPQGLILFEHGETQASRLQELLQGHGFVDIFTLKDLAGLDRITGGRK